MHNSYFWTNHIYKSHHVKYIGCSIYSPRIPVSAPSTDALDIDACTDVLVKGCRMEVNDDSVVLKGGKGPWADSAEENGANERIIVEDCESYYCHGGLTCGSESVHNRNVIFRRVKIHGLLNLLWLKMRPDTPQRYEYISVEDVEGSVNNLVNINPWTQFYDLKDREDIPLSYADNISMKNCNCQCKTFFNVKADTSQYILSNFTLENINVSAKEDGFSADKVENIVVKNVNVSITQ
jgi:polygalacturonase